MPTNDTWTGAVSGDFDTAGNWSLNAVPNSNDDAVIDTASIQMITHSGGNDYVHSLTVGNDVFDMSGGNLSFLAGATFGFGYTQTGGTTAAPARSRSPATAASSAAAPRERWRFRSAARSRSPTIRSAVR